MADVRRGKQKRKQGFKDALEKPTKEECAVAKHLRFNTQLNKEGKFLGNNVQYFIGSKAIDILLESKWAAKNTKTPPLFTSRSMCQSYCERLLEKGFFHRVQKFEKRDRKKRLKDGTEKKPLKDEPAVTKKKSKKDKDKDKEKEIKEKEKDKSDKDKESKDKEPEPEKEKEADEKDGKEVVSKTPEVKPEKSKDDSSTAEEKKRRKKKPKFEMHDSQRFIDGPELYVWIYDPVPVKTFIIGLLLVFGSIAVCLFPLWPPEVRLGVYYLSIAAACFVGAILALCIVRVIIFGIVWMLTVGKMSFWLLPNLTEDVGFFESFRPVYLCEFKSASKTPAKSEEVSSTPDVAAGDASVADEAAVSGKGETETDENEAGKDGTEDKAGEDGEGEEGEEGDGDGDVELEEGEVDEEGSEEDENVEGTGTGSDEDEAGQGDERVERGSEDEGRKSGGSSNNDNGYEIVDPDEVENIDVEKTENVEISGADINPAVRLRHGKKGGKHRQAD